MRRRANFCVSDSPLVIISSRQATEARSLGTYVKPGERPCVAGVEDGANVGVIGDERGRLKRADLISFTEGGHWRQRRVERGRSLWIETAPVQLGAAAG